MRQSSGERAARRHFPYRAAGLLGAAALALGLVHVAARAQNADTNGALELVDPHVFRACADPRDLPFSDQAGEGFENKIAELFSKKLG